MFSLLYFYPAIIYFRAFGVVYKAKDKRSNRVVAVKKMQLNESNIADIRRELCTLQEIKCPSCVEYLGSYFKDGNLFVRFFFVFGFWRPYDVQLTMEFFEGGSIGDIFSQILFLRIIRSCSCSLLDS
jgi:serine/threonine protein kinase